MLEAGTELPPGADVAPALFPWPFTGETKARIVPLAFPHPKDISVVKSPTLLLRAYVTHDGAADELKITVVSGMESGTEVLLTVPKPTISISMCIESSISTRQNSGIHSPRSPGTHCNCPDIESGHNIPTLDNTQP